MEWTREERLGYYIETVSSDYDRGNKGFLLSSNESNNQPCTLRRLAAETIKKWQFIKLGVQRIEALKKDDDASWLRSREILSQQLLVRLKSEDDILQEAILALRKQK